MDGPEYRLDPGDRRRLRLSTFGGDGIHPTTARTGPRRRHPDGYSAAAGRDQRRLYRNRAGAAQRDLRAALRSGHRFCRSALLRIQRAVPFFRASISLRTLADLRVQLAWRRGISRRLALLARERRLVAPAPLRTRRNRLCRLLWRPSLAFPGRSPV